MHSRNYSVKTGAIYGTHQLNQLYSTTRVRHQPQTIRGYAVLVFEKKITVNLNLFLKIFLRKIKKNIINNFYIQGTTLKPPQGPSVHNRIKTWNIFHPIPERCANDLYWGGSPRDHVIIAGTLFQLLNIFYQQ